MTQFLKEELMRTDPQFHSASSYSGHRYQRLIGNGSYGQRRHTVLGICLALLCALVTGEAMVDVASAQGPPPMPPTAQNDWDFADYNGFVIIDVLANDSGVSAPLAPYSVMIVTQPQLGTVTVDPLTGSVAYVPDGTADGIDWFEYTVEDIDGNLSNTARVDVFLLNMSPTINDFQAAPVTGNTWLFSGQITDENPGAASVTLGGIIDVANVPVAADGTFSTTAVLPPNAFGPVTAEVYDELGLSSGPTFVIAGSPPPTAYDDWEFTGYTEFVVIDILANDTATAAPLAPYSITIVTQPQLGTVTVDPLTGLVGYMPNGTADGIDWFEYTVEDEAGNYSNTARVEVILMNSAPVINNFRAHAGTGNTWTFTGQITDEKPSAMSLSFSGIVTEPNVPVQADGSFSITIQLAPEAFGTVIANAVDELGMQAETAYITAGQY